MKVQLKQSRLRCLLQRAQCLRCCVLKHSLRCAGDTCALLLFVAAPSFASCAIKSICCLAVANTCGRHSSQA